MSRRLLALAILLPLAFVAPLSADTLPEATGDMCVESTPAVEAPEALPEPGDEVLLPDLLAPGEVDREERIEACENSLCPAGCFCVIVRNQQCCYGSGAACWGCH